MQIQETNLQQPEIENSSNPENSEGQETDNSQPEEEQEQSNPSELAAAGTETEGSVIQNYSDSEHSREQIRSNHEGSGRQARSLANSVDQVRSQRTVNPEPQSRKLSWIWKEGSSKSFLPSNIDPWFLDPEFNNMRQAQEQLKNLLEDKTNELMNEKIQKNRLQQQLILQNEDKDKYKAKVNQLKQKIKLYQIKIFQLNLVNLGFTINYGQFKGQISIPAKILIDYGVDGNYYQQIFKQVQLTMSQFLQKKQKVKNLQDQIQKINTKLKAQMTIHPNTLHSIQTIHTLIQNLQQQLSKEQQLYQDCRSKLNQLKQQAEEKIFQNMENIKKTKSSNTNLQSTLKNTHNTDQIPPLSLNFDNNSRNTINLFSNSQIHRQVDYNLTPSIRIIKTSTHT